MFPLLIVLLLWTSSLFCPEPLKDYLRALNGDKNLQGAYLAGFDLTGKDLSHANLRHATLTGTILKNTNLTHADLTNAHLANADLRNIQAQYANFTQVRAKHANFSGAYLAHALFVRARLKHTNFDHTNLENTNFTDAKLNYAIINLENHTTKNSDNISIASLDNDLAPFLDPNNNNLTTQSDYRFQFTNSPQRRGINPSSSYWQRYNTTIGYTRRNNNNNEPMNSRALATNNNINAMDQQVTHENSTNAIGYLPTSLQNLINNINSLSSNRELPRSPVISSLSYGSYQTQSGFYAFASPIQSGTVENVHLDDLGESERFVSQFLDNYESTEPTHTFKNLIQLKIDSEEAQEECPICSDNKVTVSTPCLHKFCETCITKWAKESTTCPICRQNIEAE